MGIFGNHGNHRTRHTKVKKMNTTPDTTIAKQNYLTHCGEFNKLSKSLVYANAYVQTNENLHDIIKITPPNAAVLTVSGSGDHPLFYALNNAQTIDTFDITWCALAITDIKTSAIHELNYNQYYELINNLYFARDFTNIKNMDTILAKTPKTTTEFVYKMNGCKIFSNGLEPNAYQGYKFTPDEFNKLQQKNLTPFNFIWSDLGELHT